jgi:hypothetical protein
MNRLLSLMFVVAACGGPSKTEIKEARDALYPTDFKTVWEAVRAEVHEGYGSLIDVEDEKQGIIKTRWKTIDALHDQSQVESTLTADQRSAGNTSRRVFRLHVRIEPGGPPWYVYVDGQAALYRPGFPVMQPYEHGAEDEPEWVGMRIDKVRVGIHRRLRSAVAVAPEKK